MVGVSEGTEDWFERALQSEDGADDDASADLPDEAANDGVEAADGTTVDDGPNRDGSAIGDGPTTEDDPERADDDSLFEEDFASALSGSGAAGVGDAEGFGDALDVDDDPAAGTGFGMNDGFGGDDLGGGFDGDDFGMGGGFGGGDFDDEEFESDLPRIELGIEGLDDMIQGGVPERSLMVTIGSAGTGKTTFGLQFLNHALERGERAVYITLEESKHRVVNSATEKGYAFDEYVDEGRLAVVDIDPVEMANSLTSIRSELPRLVDEFGASRLVLDSVSLLEMMYDDRATRRNEIYDFTKSLKRAGVTTMLTSEASEDSPYASRHGIVEYLTDAVFILQYVRPSDFRETRLAVEIQKIRDANHSRETKPYEITNEGLSVYRQANIF
ncbi:MULTISPECIES: KaiC domain-containing protein [Halostella]|uniref:KaiC domain-containing protein n=1 Tax=Halostella TaxID=1843185 RepID=UPI001969D3A1|nr:MULTISPECIES: KaiC domain-containing protein [Halostella]